MKKIKILLPLLFVLNGSGCVSLGPTVVIETPEPAEDIVVVCNKSKKYIISHGASGYNVIYNVMVTKSGEKQDCGIMFTGQHSYVSVLHPVYTSQGGESFDKDGVRYIVLKKTKLDILEEQKAQFEAGYWDKSRNPERSYLSGLPGCSGFPPKYLEYYSEERNIDREEFMHKYHDKMLECVRKEYEEILKHDPYSAKQLPTPDKRMEMLWDPVIWRKYE